MKLTEAAEDYAAKISKYIVEFKKEELTEETIKRVKATVLDTLGCMIFASRTMENLKIRKFLAKGDPLREVRIFAFPPSISIEDACFYGSHLAAFLDFDTGHRLGGVHSSAVAVPCALLVSERDGLSGMDVIRQIVVGTEISSRLGMATQPYQFRRGIDPSGTCNIFTSIGIFSLAFDLDQEQITEAIRIGSMLAPLSPTQWTYTGSMSKSLSIAVSAKLGYMAVQLGKIGFTGPERSLEGPEGFLNGVVAPFEHNTKAILDPPLGQMEINRLYFKLYPVCGWIHSVIDATLGASEGQIFPEDFIERVEVNVSEQVARQSNTDPKDETTAKFSIPFCTSVALLRGCVRLEHFSEDQLKAPDVARLCQKIKVKGISDFEKLFPKVRPADVSIFLKNAQILRAKVDYPKGDPENPASQDEIQNKFLNLTKEILYENQQDEIISLVASLEKMVDLYPLVRAVGV